MFSDKIYKLKLVNTNVPASIHSVLVMILPRDKFVVISNKIRKHYLKSLLLQYFAQHHVAYEKLSIKWTKPITNLKILKTVFGKTLAEIMWPSVLSKSLLFILK